CRSRTSHGSWPLRSSGRSRARRSGWVVAGRGARGGACQDGRVSPRRAGSLAGVVGCGGWIFAASAGPLTLLRLSAAATFMGLGIVSMHYLGMSALHASAHMHHAPAFVAASVAVAIAASGLALFLAGGRSGRPPLIFSATVLGFAIAGMHY